MFFVLNFSERDMTMRFGSNVRADFQRKPNTAALRASA
jgi:hypothetical protein